MDRKDIPKVIVKKAHLVSNVEMITELLTPEFNTNNTSLPFEDRLYGLLPELKEQIHIEMAKEEIYQQVYKLIKSKYTDEEAKIQKRVGELQKLFDEVMSEVIGKMLDIFEIQMPQNIKQIICYIGYYPVFPRDVQTKEYWVNYSTIDEKILRGSVHEINHFIMFEKWKDMHGYERVCQPVHPETLWFLEEIIVDPTLNDATMQSIAPYPQQAYVQFYKQTLGGIVIMDYIKELYNKRSNMQQFLDSAYEFLNKNLIELIEKCG